MAHTILSCSNLLIAVALIVCSLQPRSVRGDGRVCASDSDCTVVSINNKCIGGICCTFGSFGADCTECQAGTGICTKCTGDRFATGATCHARRNPGESCGSTDYFCLSNKCLSYCCNPTGIDSKCDSCQSGAGTCSRCQGGYYLTGTFSCELQKANGQPCGADNQCSSNICKGSTCCQVGTSGSCSSCDGSGLCTVCTGSTYLVGGNCQAKKNPGESCITDSMCDSNSCITSYCCRSDVVSGCTACNATGDCSTCNAARYLDVASGKCLVDLADGAVCSIDAMCTSGSCKSGICCNVGSAGDASCIGCGAGSGACAACSVSHYLSGAVCSLKKTAGQVCSNDGQCADGNCRGVTSTKHCCNTASNANCSDCEVASGSCKSCVAPQYLVNGACTSPTVVAGGTCVNEDECVAGFGCKGGRCCADSDSSCTACNNSGACSSCTAGHFVDIAGRCAVQKPDGEMCAGGNECDSSICLGRCCQGSGEATNCSSCSATGGCASCKDGYFLNATNFCEPKKVTGPCTEDAMCSSGQCMGINCCSNAAAALNCVSCDAMGSCSACVSDSFWRNGASCVAKIADGEVCSSNASCVSSVCQERCCMNSSYARVCGGCGSDGKCARCDEGYGLSADGLCVIVTPVPTTQQSTTAVPTTPTSSPSPPATTLLVPTTTEQPATTVATTTAAPTTGTTSAPTTVPPSTTFSPDTTTPAPPTTTSAPETPISSPMTTANVPETTPETAPPATTIVPETTVPPTPPPTASPPVTTTVPETAAPTPMPCVAFVPPPQQKAIRVTVAQKSLKEGKFVVNVNISASVGVASRFTAAINNSSSNYSSVFPLAVDNEAIAVVLDEAPKVPPSTWGAFEELVDPSTRRLRKDVAGVSVALTSDDSLQITLGPFATMDVEGSSLGINVWLTRDWFSAGDRLCPPTSNNFNGMLLIGTIAVEPDTDSVLKGVHAVADVVGTTALAVGSAPELTSMAVLARMSCTGPSTKQSAQNDRLLSPLPLGDSLESKVAGNLVLMLAVAVLNAAAFLGIRLVKKEPDMLVSMAAVKFPDIAMRVALFLHQGTMFLSFQLIVDRTNGSIALGVLGVLASLGLPVALMVYGTRRISAVFVSYDFTSSSESGKASAKPVPRWLQVVLPRGRWEPREMKQAYGVLFKPFESARPFAFLLPVASPALMAVAALPEPKSVEGCKQQFGWIIAMQFTYAAILAGARPYRAAVLNIIAVMSAGCVGLLGLSAVLTLSDPNSDGAKNLAVSMVLIQTMATAARMAFGALCMLREKAIVEGVATHETLRRTPHVGSGMVQQPRKEVYFEDGEDAFAEPLVPMNHSSSFRKSAAEVSSGLEDLPAVETQLRRRRSVAKGDRGVVDGDGAGAVPPSMPPMPPPTSTSRFDRSRDRDPFLDSRAGAMSDSIL